MMTCKLCDEKHDNMLNHVRLMHSDVLDEAWKLALGDLLKPVTQSMHDYDHVCESCDRQFALGMTFGEIFEGMFGKWPIVSLVCGECFMGRGR